jgi:hypothetical protein
MALPPTGRLAVDRHDERVAVESEDELAAGDAEHDA